MTMVQTGTDIFKVLSILATIAPLLPIVILFTRHAALTTTINLLRITCVVVFVQNLATAIPALTALYSPFISAIFRLAEFSLLYYLLVQAAFPKRFREIMILLLVSFVSVVITIHALVGPNEFPTTITAIKAFILVLLALIALLKLISNSGIVLFREPLFWIAGGVICYFGTFLFIEIITRIRMGVPQDIGEKLLVFSIAGIGRFIFFSIAAFVSPVGKQLTNNRLDIGEQ